VTRKVVGVFVRFRAPLQQPRSMPPSKKFATAKGHLDQERKNL
jgi:hypothetical protein